MTSTISDAEQLERERDRRYFRIMRLGAWPVPPGCSLTTCQTTLDPTADQMKASASDAFMRSLNACTMAELSALDEEAAKR